MLSDLTSVRPSCNWPSVRCPAGLCPLTPSLHDAISPYLAKGFQGNLAKILIIWVDVAGKFFFQIGDQRSRS